MNICTASYPLPDINIKELKRYAGILGTTYDSTEYDKLISESITVSDGIFTPKLCYCEVDISINNDTVDFGFASVKSKALAKCLCGCTSAIVFAATIGKELDRLIARKKLSSVALPFMLSALGSERAEALCNVFCAELKKEKEMLGKQTAPRFSPGYGDLPLEFQTEIFRLLGATARIGISLGENLLMSPSKSVTAIVGIKEK